MKLRRGLTPAFFLFKLLLFVMVQVAAIFYIYMELKVFHFVSLPNHYYRRPPIDFGWTALDHNGGDGFAFARRSEQWTTSPFPV